MPTKNIDIACSSTPICQILVDGKPLKRLYLVQSKGASMCDGNDLPNRWDVHIDGIFIAQVPKDEIYDQAKVWERLINDE